MAFDYLYDAAHAWTFQDTVNGMKFKNIKGLEAAVINTRVALRKCERFVLDDDFVCLAMEASTQLEKLPSWATLARLPFDTVWIEWDQNVRTRKTVELGLTIESDDYPKAHRVGGLFQHWHSNHAWTYSEFAMETEADEKNYSVLASTLRHIHDPEGELGLATHEDTKWVADLMKDIPWPTRMIGVWPGRSSDTPESEARAKRYCEQMAKHSAMVMSPQFEVVSDHYAKTGNQETLLKMRQVLRGNMLMQGGVMRFLIAVLAMINDVPKSVATVAPRTGSYKARFRNLAYMGHSLITLKVPKARPARFVMAKLDKSVRERAQANRAHTVRGHYRRTNYSPRGTHTSFRCDHEPLRVQDGVGTCNKCGHEVRWIPHFVRGDASLGWVQHDYLVKAA